MGGQVLSGVWAELAVDIAKSPAKVSAKNLMKSPLAMREGAESQ
jgi:hypothetical protein